MKINAHNKSKSSRLILLILLGIFFCDSPDATPIESIPGELIVKQQLKLIYYIFKTDSV